MFYGDPEIWSIPIFLVLSHLLWRSEEMETGRVTSFILSLFFFFLGHPRGGAHGQDHVTHREPAPPPAALPGENHCESQPNALLLTPDPQLFSEGQNSQRTLCAWPRPGPRLQKSESPLDPKSNNGFSVNPQGENPSEWGTVTRVGGQLCPAAAPEVGPPTPSLSADPYIVPIAHFVITES